jgi:transposase
MRNYKDFETAEQLASWCGLIPKVSQSADKLVTGSITKHGSKHVEGCWFKLLMPY